MTSYFEHHGRLSNRTIQAWNRMPPETTANRLSFYMLYLQDVVPYDVAVCHVPRNAQAHDLNEGLTRDTSQREEIQLRCAEGILMTSLLSSERYPSNIEPTAAALAYEHWRNGWLVPDHRQAWGMFTCLQTIRFCISLNGTNYERVSNLDPLYDVRDVVRYIRREYERIRRR